jgi:hypothetical protein
VKRYERDTRERRRSTYVITIPTKRPPETARKSAFADTTFAREDQDLMFDVTEALVDLDQVIQVCLLLLFPIHTVGEALTNGLVLAPGTTGSTSG